MSYEEEEENMCTLVQDRNGCKVMLIVESVRPMDPNDVLTAIQDYVNDSYMNLEKMFDYYQEYDGRHQQ